jgi:hypothetical protein
MGADSIMTDYLQSRGTVVFGADFWASDGNHMAPKGKRKLITNQLKTAREKHPELGGHAGGLLALSWEQRLSRRRYSAGGTRCRETALTPNLPVNALQLRLHSRRSMQ